MHVDPGRRDSRWRVVLQATYGRAGRSFDGGSHLEIEIERAEQATKIAALRAEAENTRAEVQRDHVEADRARTLAVLEGRITEHISLEEAFGR
jgi:hypothetical protein